MKTRDLIAALEAADPSGDLECCVNNVPIYYVDAEPAYHDGPLEMLVQDETKSCYNIIGFKVTDVGTKVQIETASLEECILSNPELPVDLSEVGYHLDYWNERIETQRAKCRAAYAKVAADEAKATAL